VYLQKKISSGNEEIEFSDRENSNSSSDYLGHSDIGNLPKNNQPQGNIISWPPTPKTALLLRPSLVLILFKQQRIVDKFLRSLCGCLQMQSFSQRAYPDISDRLLMFRKAAFNTNEFCRLFDENCSFSFRSGNYLRNTRRLSRVSQQTNTITPMPIEHSMQSLLYELGMILGKNDCMRYQSLANTSSIGKNANDVSSQKSISLEVQRIDLTSDSNSLLKSAGSVSEQIIRCFTHFSYFAWGLAVLHQDSILTNDDRFRIHFSLVREAFSSAVQNSLTNLSEEKPYSKRPPRLSRTHTHIWSTRIREFDHLENGKDSIYSPRVSNVNEMSDLSCALISGFIFGWCEAVLQRKLFCKELFCQQGGHNDFQHKRHCEFLIGFEENQISLTKEFPSETSSSSSSFDLFVRPNSLTIFQVHLKACMQPKGNWKSLLTLRRPKKETKENIPFSSSISPPFTSSTIASMKPQDISFKDKSKNQFEASFSPRGNEIEESLSDEFFYVRCKSLSVELCQLCNASEENDAFHRFIFVLGRTLAISDCNYCFREGNNKLLSLKLLKSNDSQQEITPFKTGKQYSELSNPRDQKIDYLMKYMEYIGWGRLRILKSEDNPNENTFSYLISVEGSCECDSWIDHYRTSPSPSKSSDSNSLKSTVCTMICGYIEGIFSHILGTNMAAVEVNCRATTTNISNPIPSSTSTNSSKLSKTATKDNPTYRVCTFIVCACDKLEKVVKKYVSERERNVNIVLPNLPTFRLHYS